MLTIQGLYLVAFQSAIVTGIVTFLLLPAIVELRKPTDLGPRLIKDNTVQTFLVNFRIGIINIDEETEVENQSKMDLSVFLQRFPNSENQFI